MDFLAGNFCISMAIFPNLIGVGLGSVFVIENQFLQESQKVGNHWLKYAQCQLKFWLIKLIKNSKFQILSLTDLLFLRRRLSN